MKHLMSKCEGFPVCREAACAEAAKQGPNGRWYITMGHAGFNCKPNNGNGFLTEDNARRTMRLYLDRAAKSDGTEPAGVRHRTGLVVFG